MTDEKNTVANDANVPGSKLLGKGPVWVMILIIGPLAIPFLLLSPHFSKKAKIGISLALLLLSVLFFLLGNIAMEMATSLGVI